MRLFYFTFVFLIASAGNSATPSMEFLNRLQSNGTALNVETVGWIEKWRLLDLEQNNLYDFGEISGSTSINIKVRMKDATDPKGYKSRGTLVPRNSAGNPNTEIAYFNLAALFGIDNLIRPAVRYELGTNASAALRDLLLATPMTHPARQKNKERILAELMTGVPLKGCLKAKKPDSAIAVEDVALVHAKIQGSSSQPQAGKLVALETGYLGDEQILARELSVLMTLDGVFGQWDRFSGGNIGVRLDHDSRAHFYFTDNGGATLSSTTSAVAKTLGWFSRYDRNLIQKLRELNSFLAGESASYLGYSSPQQFIMELGLYFEELPETYVQRVKRNIDLVLARVDENERLYGSAAYFF